MSDPVIQVDGITKDYGHGRGIFDVSFHVMPGEIYGYIGTNGSGKTTTLRSVMGFIRPDKGSVSVLGQDAWKKAPDLKQFVSYIPGEIEFPHFKTGLDFLNYQSGYTKNADTSYRDELIELLELDPTANLRRMSKGMKQKTAIVAALMGDKQILVLDEPTTGLDPLKRNVFLDLLLQEKARGRTVLFSTHIFEEVEAVCDRVSIISDGHIIDTASVDQILHGQDKRFHVAFADAPAANSFSTEWKQVVAKEGQVVHVSVAATEIQAFFQTLDRYPVAGVEEWHMTLEEHFKTIFDGKVA